MRFARLFDGIGESGQPYFATDHRRIDDETERGRIAQVLGSGKVIRRVGGFDIDRVDKTRGRVVPRSTLTDGVWIWNAGMRYYLETYGLAPEDDFLAHIVTSGYVARVPDETTWRRALDLLRSGQSGR